jgi:hypothetical protein
MCLIQRNVYIFCFYLGDRLTLYTLSMMEDGRFLAAELASTTLPFSFAARVRFKGVLKMMAIFNVDIM